MLYVRVGANEEQRSCHAPPTYEINADSAERIVDNRVET
jgi:hypothetical protein